MGGRKDFWQRAPFTEAARPRSWCDLLCRSQGKTRACARVCVCKSRVTANGGTRPAHLPPGPGWLGSQVRPARSPPRSIRPGTPPSRRVEVRGRPPAYRFVCADGVHLRPEHHGGEDEEEQPLETQ